MLAERRRVVAEDAKGWVLVVDKWPAKRTCHCRVLDALSGAMERHGELSDERRKLLEEGKIRNPLFEFLVEATKGIRAYQDTQDSHAPHKPIGYCSRCNGYYLLWE